MKLRHCEYVNCVENGNHDMCVTCFSKTRFRFMNLLSKSIEANIVKSFMEKKLQIKSTFFMSNSIKIYNKKVNIVQQWLVPNKHFLLLHFKV